MNVVFKEFMKFLIKRPLYFAGFIIVLIFIVVGSIAPYILTKPEDAWGLTYDLDKAFKPPSPEHLFGTDALGRDMLNRVILGSRYSLLIALSVVLLSLAIGVIVGLVSGYIGGAVGTVLMRITDMFLAYPPLLLAIALATVLGRGVVTTIIALATTWWPWYARLMYITVNSVKSAPYVEAAKVIGLSRWAIMTRYIVPNSLTPVITQAMLDIGSAILEAASLSFLGVGVPPPIPEWGRLISEGWQYIGRAYWISLFPGLTLLITVVGFNLFGDAVKEYLNPRLRNVAQVRI
ncbi:MAG: ABC transporter permease [Desulfurococcaceae archaeon]|nr:ABC transporter permease [Desulfurococcaceae archaeon]